MARYHEILKWRFRRMPLQGPLLLDSLVLALEPDVSTVSNALAVGIGGATA